MSDFEVRPMRRGEIEEMMAEHERLNPDRPIRPDIKEALDRYANHGILPGDFLTAVLENDLMKAMGGADSYNRATIFQICQHLYNNMPSTCWGSPEKVANYLNQFKETQHE